MALGLARSLSRDRSHRVLLLELDLRRPALDDELGLKPPATGLRQYLAGKCDVPVLRRSRPAGFWLLAAGGGAASNETIRRAAALLKPGLIIGVVLNAQRDIF